MKVPPDLFAGVLPFVRTAEEKSFGRAAASLGVTTAAVSKAVRRLEDGLGVRLLERSSRVVALTRDGEAFYARSREAVLGVLGARAAVETGRREPQGELSVTLPGILAPFVVGGLGRIASRYPRLAFRIDVSDRVARIASESYDVAVRMGPLEDSSLRKRLLRRTRWVTVAAPAYLARRAAPRRPEELDGHNCLSFVGPSGRVRDWTFASGPRAVRGNLQIDHGAHLLTAALSGLGVAHVLDFMAAEALRRGDLVEVLAPFAAEGPNVHAVTTTARAGSANVRAFMSFLQEVFA